MQGKVSSERSAIPPVYVGIGSNRRSKRRSRLGSRPSCCGIVGLKPSRGRVTVAPVADVLYGGAYDLCVSRTIRDTASYLDALAGPAPGDPYFAPKPTGSSWLSLSVVSPPRLRVGFSLKPHPPRPLGYLSMSEQDIDRYNGKWTDAAFMYPFNISGLPALSLPLHWSADGLPIGVQFVSHFGDETTLLQLGPVLEQEMSWRARLPPVCA